MRGSNHRLSASLAISGDSLRATRPRSRRTPWRLSATPFALRVAPSAASNRASRVRHPPPMPLGRRDHGAGFRPSVLRSNAPESEVRNQTHALEGTGFETLVLVNGARRIPARNTLPAVAKMCCDIASPCAAAAARPQATAGRAAARHSRRVDDGAEHDATAVIGGRSPFLAGAAPGYSGSRACG